MNLWLAWAMLNLAAFAAGLLLPIVTVSQLYVFDSDIVLLDVPVVLAKNGEWLLAAIVLLLGIVLPVAKTLAYTIALLIFVAKGAFASDAATAIGMYPLVFFACSSKLIEWAFARKFVAGAA